jgi:hypothetical protein
MIRVLLQGRLGNHLFQIAAGLALARSHGVPLVVDACLLPEVTNDLELRRLTVLQLPFPRRTASIACDRLNRRVRGRHSHEVVRAERYTEPGHDFDPAFRNLGRSAVLRGFFQSESYFAGIAADLRQWFDFAPWLQRAPAECREAVAQPMSVGVHVRRRDYIGTFWELCDRDYYLRAAATIRDRFPTAHFVVVSDDPAWCRTQLGHLPSTIVDSSADPYTALVDLAVLAGCRHQVIANSSFSWWAGWLNAKPGRIVFAPDRWTNDDSIAFAAKRFAGMETLPTR